MANAVGDAKSADIDNNAEFMSDRKGGSGRVIVNGNKLIADWSVGERRRN